MNEVELLVHGREVTLEQQKAAHARVIWYVPCISNFCSPGILKLFNPFSHVHKYKNHWVFGILLGNRKYILQDNPWIDKRQGSST